MRTFWACAVACVGLSLATVEAEASIHLCAPATIQRRPFVEVSANPTLMTGRAHMNDPGLVVNLETGLPLPYTAEPVDEHWARVTIRAKVGDTFWGRYLPGQLGCGNGYRVTATKGDRVPLGVDGESPWAADGQLRLEHGKQWARIDWAYTDVELDEQGYGSWYDGTFTDTVSAEHFVEHAPLVFVRVQRFEVDGTTAHWRGWIYRRPDGTVQVGTGRAPVAPPARPRCDVVAPRPVPVDPTFYVDETRFRAITATGEALPLTVEEDGLDTRVAVRASEGTVFALQRLPIASCEEVRWLRATRDRSHDPAPVVVRGDDANGAGAPRLELADAWTWGRLEVERPTSRSDDEIASGVSVFSLDASAPDHGLVHVRITPVWGTQRGTSWTGWVDARPGRGVRFWADAPPVVSPPAPDEPAPRRALFACLGLALLVAALRRWSSAVAP
jgi:hypothetical protein